ncbi:MAG: ATP-dependent DNA ligase, partial [Minisyncoccales bacterium]
MKYEKIANLYKKLENTPSTLEKTKILSSFLKKLKGKKNKEIIYLLQGRAFPDYIKKDLGISENLIQSVLKKATGASNKEITQKWKEKGDLGLVAEELVKNKSQRTLSDKTLTSEKVLKNIQKLPKFKGKGTVDKKISIVAELITAAKPLEARYLVRTVLHDLRIGVGSGTIRDAITRACFESGKEKEDKEDKKKSKKLVQEAYDKTTDFAKVFEKACKGEKALKNMELKPGKPLKVMLFQKANTIKEGFETVGKPALLDYKYDGFRMLVNKDKNGEIKIFTRRLDNITKQFPEVKEYVEEYVKGENFILDTEAVGYDPDKKEYMPFQNISQRIKRKYNIEKMRKKLPIEVNVFDILYYNGKSKLNEPLKKRRKLIEEIVKNKEWKIRTAKALETGNLKEAKKFYGEALKEGEEGVMMKNLNSEYKPGSRVGYGVKI